MNSSTVSAEVGLRLVLTPQTIVPLTGSLSYSRQDPYAVRIAFRVGLEEPVEWIFARDLLARLIMPIMAPRIYASRARRVYGTPTPPRIQAATRLPAQVADEFGAEQATPGQTLGS